MKSVLTAFKFFLIMTLITGVIYPIFISVYANLFIKDLAGGSLIIDNGEVKGSELISQKFAKPEYFWSRPSSADYSSAPSGASNLGPTSADLKAKVEERKASLLAVKETTAEIPQDLLFASGSGLDPHLSPEAILYQIERVAAARGLEVITVHNLVKELTEPPQFGIFGKRRVNVLRLNLALDNLKPN